MNVHKTVVMDVAKYLMKTVALRRVFISSEHQLVNRSKTCLKMKTLKSI